MTGSPSNDVPRTGNGLRRLLLALPDGVLLLDRNGSVRFANPAAERLFACEPGSMVGCTLGCPVLEGTAEVEIPRQGEGMAVAEIRAVEVEWDGERLTLATFRDVTGRKQAEEKTVILGRELLEVYETLQNRLGKEIHDAIGQPLVGLKLALQRFRELQEQDRQIGLGEVGLLIDDMVDVVRELSHSLRPTTGRGWSLQEALENHFHRFERNTGLQIRFRARGLQRRIPRLTEVVGFRIVQEALANAARYSGARSLEVRAAADGAVLTLEVEDRGAGFDPATVSAEAVGIRGMRERARLAGGRLSVESAPRRGTRISATLPLEPPAAGGDPNPNHGPG